MNKQIIEEAAEWFVEFSTGDPDRSTKQAFDAWLRQSPQHVRVYLELLPTWEDAALPLPGQSASAGQLIAWARQSESVVSWHGTRESTAPAAIAAVINCQAARSPSKSRLPRIRLAWAASMVLATVGAFLFWSFNFKGQTYTTGIGEQRIIKLDDGSTVELNTASRIRVHFSKHQRDIDLSQGQALFHVAKDRTRPFIVASNVTRIRAVGTEFDVYRRESGTTVTVLEGQVTVLNNSARTNAGTADATPLSEGEQITVNAPAAAAPPSRRHTNVSTAIAWTQHRLIFDATPLTEVAAEFNRYNTRHLIVEDKGLSDFHVSGSFASTDPSSLLRFLEAQHGLSVHESTADIRISSR
jgi:transmembrane sensor